MNGSRDFIISIDTSKDVSLESFGRDFLRAWLDQSNQLLIPEKWGFNESTRSSLTKDSVGQILASWSELPITFRRSTRPKFTLSMDWNSNSYYGRIYRWGLLCFIDKSTPNSVALELFEFLINSLDPEFAYITIYADHMRRHFIDGPLYHDGVSIGNAERVVGNHVGARIPGIYWKTFFGPEVLQRLGGSNRIRSIPIGDVEEIGRGLLLSTHVDPDAIGSDAGLSTERMIVDHIGKSHFFDRRLMHDL